MRSKFLSIACLTVAVLVCCTVFVQTLPVGAEAAAGSKTGTLEVTGKGAVKAMPDIAVLYLGVTTSGATTAIQGENSKAMEKVLESVKKLGVNEKDIKTTGYYMSPDYDYSPDYRERGRVVGYTVYNTVEVKVRNIDKAGEVLAAAAAAGANVNSGISFTISNVDEYYNQALANAYANAKDKAQTLAKAIGVNAGLPVKVTESYNNYAPVAYGNYDSKAMMEANAGGAVPVAQGELEITANITVVYEY
jgi:uncharacterized protein YggE